MGHGEHELNWMLITMVTALGAGILVMSVAHRIHISAIVLLLAAGIALGPEGVHIVRPETLGHGLPVIIALAVGIILFEGGLTLDVKGFRSAGKMIRRLLSVGVITTWIVIAIAVKFLLNESIPFSLLAGSLVIVTGPTVIAPLLKRIRVQPKLHSILHWEGVLIDPIGVFIALLCFEWYVGSLDHSATSAATRALGGFALRFAAGLGIGIPGGFIIDRLIRLRLPPRDMVNVFTLGCAVLVFGCAEVVQPEAGLLAVTSAGFVLGVRGPQELKQLKAFKAEITDLMIGMLFILLAARLKIDNFTDLGVAWAWVLGTVLFVARPLNVVLSAWGLDVSWREKAFLSWIAPRGIVAASMASLFSLTLTSKNVPNANFLETFTYSVIVSTVVLQGFTAGPVAWLLRLQRPARTGWLVVGAHSLGRKVASFLSSQAEVEVVLVDANARAVEEARREGFTAFCADARDAAGLDEDRVELLTVGSVLALTDNADLNVLLCQNWREIYGRRKVFRWGPSDDAHASSDGDGTRIWETLPRPMAVSSELFRNEARVFTQVGAIHSLDGDVTALLSVGKGGVQFGSVSRPDSSDARVTLLLRRTAAPLVRAVRPELVVTLDTSEPAEVARLVVDSVAGRVPESCRESIRAILSGKDENLLLGLGNGVAVPHLYADEIEGPACVIVRLPNGLAGIPPPDGHALNLIFLLISPVGDPELHLNALAAVASLAGDPEKRQALLTAPTPEEVVQVVRGSPIHPIPKL